jgi:hypothetical protein
MDTPTYKGAQSPLIENQTVANLRKHGFKVKVMHSRYHVRGTDELTPEWVVRTGKLGFLPKGGQTKVTVTKGNQTFKGVSLCSRKDAFNRKFGVAIALGRLHSV